MYTSGTEGSRLKCDGTPGGSGEEGGEGVGVKGQDGRAENEQEKDLDKGKSEGKKNVDARTRDEEGRGGE